jgi:hypothetical protein
LEGEDIGDKTISVSKQFNETRSGNWRKKTFSNVTVDLLKFNVLFGNKLGYDSIGINEKLLIRPLERRHNTVFEIFKHEKTSWYCKCGAESQGGWYLFTCGISDACLEYAERVKHVLIYIRLNVSDTL